MNDAEVRELMASLSATRDRGRYIPPSASEMIIALAQDYLRLKAAVRIYFDGAGRGYTLDPAASDEATRLLEQVAKEPPCQ
jgi:hypothetical protein